MTNFLTNALIDISARNQLRLESKLPTLSVAVELRRMYAAKVQAEFEEFEARNGPAVLEQVLKPWRAVLGSSFQPKFLIGMAISNEVRKQLREQLKQQKRRSS